MLSWFRSRASGVAATLLLSLATLGVSLHAPHPEDCHEADCGTILVAHDASAHRVRANTSTADTRPLHCDGRCTVIGTLFGDFTGVYCARNRQ